MALSHRIRVPFRAIMFVTGLAVAAVGVVLWLARKPEPPKSFDLYFTCDTSGRIEPCGCFTGQYGGLTRVSTFVSDNPDALKLEVGNAAAGTEDYHLIQFRHLLRAYAHIGYAAVNLGAREAGFSAQELRHLSESAPLPLLSANLIEAETGTPLAARFVIAEAGGLRFGLTGVVDPASLKRGPGDGVRVAGMAESIRRALPMLKNQCDVLVCLAFTDENGLAELARQFYEFALFLGGNVRQPSQSLTKVNRSWLLATTNQARALGKLRGVFRPGQGVLDQVTGDVRLMVDTIPEDEAVRQFSRDYRKEIRTTQLTIDGSAGGGSDRVPGVRPTAHYIGSETCRSCHPASFKSWAASAHATAFETLVRRDSDADPNCIGCHTIGFGKPGGYSRAMKGQRLTDVGCESCHGPGSRHTEVRSAKPGQEVAYKMRPVGAGQCTQCHYGEFSRPFDWQEFWPLVEHGKEPPLP